MRSSPKVRVSGWAPERADRVGAVEVGEAEDVEELGASRMREGLEALAECLLHLLEDHDGTLVRHQDERHSATLSFDTGEESPLSGRVTTGDKGPRFTRREKEVLELLADGRSIREIASQLGISSRAARTHVANIQSKLRGR
jgi:DNA-binding NarL/FixJ family response regulator